MADTAQPDLFGSQSDLFGTPAPVSYAPDPEQVRAKLLAVLDRARAAPATPWSRKDIEFYRLVFPQMANWLPDDEARQLCFQLETEIERLIAA